MDSAPPGLNRVKQCSTRMVVEHLFGTLKGHFRRLKLKLDLDKFEDIPTIVIATFIVHNVSVFHHEEIINVLNDDNDEENDYDYQNIFLLNRNGIQKRRGIIITLNAN